MRVFVVIGLSVALATSSAVAQMRSPQSAMSTADSQDEDQPSQQQQQRQMPLETNPSGGIARSSVGQVGQRQTRDTAAQQAGIKPMARIVSRIPNRVQNRIRNRIDPSYDPQANAASPFLTAEDQARLASRGR